MADVAWRALRVAGTALVRSRLEFRVEGLEFVPPSGPAIIAARHFHHLYDGCAMLATVPRPLHLLVALDWVKNRPGRIAMEQACRAAGWPVVLRRDGPTPPEPGSAARSLRRAAGETLALLEDGRVVLIFPEGYPNIDPGYTPKTGEEAFLPFQPGFVWLAALAARRGLRVPIVPAGFSYERGRRWRVTLRFGEPLIVEGQGRGETVRREIEDAVRRLSATGDPM